MKERKIQKIIAKAVVLSIISASVTHSLFLSSLADVYALSTESNNKIIQSSKSALEWQKRNNYSSTWQFLTNVREQGLTDDEKKEAVEKVKKNIDNIEKTSAANLAKDIMVLSACGIDATNFESYNLLPIMLDKVSLKNNWGIYTVPYVIMACNSYNFSGDIDSSSNQKVQDMVDYLINTQQSDGQWAGGGADAVGPALYALSIYKDDENVKKSIDKAVNYLKNNQASSGSFADSFSKAENSNSLSMAVLGLAACGVDLEKDFIKDKSTVDSLLNYQIKDLSDSNNGAFLWKMDVTGGYPAATEQAVYSLAQAVGGADYKIFDFKSNWTIESVSVDKLQAKYGINIDNGKISWDAMDNAVKYVVYVNGTKSGETTDLTYVINNYKESDKIEVAAVDMSGNLLYKADSSVFINKPDSNNQDNKNGSTYTYNYTDSHNQAYTNSPVVTNSPNYTGYVSDNSIVINMGSIYNASGKSKVTNNVDIDGKKYSQQLEEDDGSDSA